ncbi:MAG TPA: hypothetical protein VMJ10_21500 [Kofleriaceae bacterium]|nr:hypothetical protein [Kofleriaceae bacterium]
MTFRALAFACLLACHHDAPPAQEPTDKPPLPSASGTPIGFLIDGAGELRLRDDQVVKLRDIDTSLATELDALDTRLRAANKPQDQGSGSQQGGRVHMHGGGMGRNGMGGRNRTTGQGSGSGSHTAALANGLSDQRAADVKEALHRAFEVLDADQREGAKKILSDHDIDVDDDTAAAAMPAGPPPTLPPPGGNQPQQMPTGADGEPGEQ